MPVAPIVEKEGQLQSYGAPTQNYQREVEGGIGATLQAVGKVGQEYAQKGIERANEVRMIEAQRAVDQWETSTLFDPKNGAFAKKGKDAFTVPEEVQKGFTTFAETYRETLANDAQKEAFDKLTVQRWGSLAPRVQTHVREQMDTYAKGQSAALQSSSENRAAMYWNDDKTVDEIAKQAAANAEKDAIAQGASAEEIAANKAKAESGIRYAQFTMLADRDPKKALEYADKHMGSLYGEDLKNAQKAVSITRENVAAQDAVKAVAGSPVVGQENIIKFVMSEKIEGGDKVAIDSDGGTVKFGMNHLHNNMTKEEVAGLTEEQALAKYKENYWTPMGLDKLSPDMQLVAFDAAVNHGADATTKKMIEDANGDPMKLIQIRADYYRKLAVDDPEKNGPQLKGWMNRLATIKSQVEAVQGEMPTLADAYAKIDASTTNPDVAAKAKALYKQQLDAIESARKQREDGAAQKVAEYEARGEEPPVTLIAQLNPQKQLDRQQKAYDPIEYERVRQQVSFGQPVDLEQFRWRFSPQQFNLLAEMQANPVEQVKQRAIDKQVTENFQSLTGKGAPKEKMDFERINTFRNILDGSVKAHEKLSGKPATPDDIKKIAKDLTAKPSSSMWSSDDQTDVAGVPRAKGRYLIGGTPVEYADLIAALSVTAKSNNLPVTPTTMTIIFNDLVKQGKIADKYK